MTVSIEDVLLWSLAQDGDKYVFGAEVPLAASDSDRWDCSELVEWSCGKAGVLPRVPDGAYYQWQHCNKSRLNIPVERGITTRGALLFVGDGTGVGRDAITHVAWSLGDGTTIEARGKAWGVGSWPSAGRFDFAGLLPGVDYSPPSEDDMPLTPADILKVAEAVTIALKPQLEQLEADIKTRITEVQGNLSELERRVHGVPDMADGKEQHLADAETGAAFQKLLGN